MNYLFLQMLADDVSYSTRSVCEPQIVQRVAQDLSLHPYLKQFKFLSRGATSSVKDTASPGLFG